MADSEKNDTEKWVQGTLLHMQGQIDMLKDCILLSLGFGVLHIPWYLPLLREALQQKTLNLLPGEGKKELDAGYQRMKDLVLEFLDGMEKDTDKFFDEMRKRNPLEVINEMENNPKEFIEKIKKIAEEEKG